MYKIRLKHFEGPLDLLLFFIKRDELDIYDIPIAQITKEFIEYVKLMEQLDLEIAGDFILMASTLMQIKVRMLLPRQVDSKGEEIDPRSDLVAALLEYKRYKEVSEELSYFEATQRKRNFRGNFDSDDKEAPEEFNTLLKNITIYDLMKAFRKVMEEKPKEAVHEIKKVPVTIDQQSDLILTRVKGKQRVSFIDLVQEMHDKIVIVVTFIAMLELVKMQRVGLEESPNFNDFIVYGLEDG